jgi:hypothetical protein
MRRIISVPGLDFLAQNHTRLPFEKLTSPPLPLEQLNEGFELTRTRQWQRVAIIFNL